MTEWVLGLIGGLLLGLVLGIKAGRRDFRAQFYYRSPHEICRGCNKRPVMDGHDVGCPVHKLGIK
jgi:hypothetical protein